MTKGYIGSTPISKVYLGTTLIWPAETPEPVYPYEAVYSPHDEIWYTTEEGEIFDISSYMVKELDIISNTYVDGKGVIKFNHTLTEMPDLYLSISGKTVTSVYYPKTVERIKKDAFINNTLKRINCNTDGVIIVGENVKVIEDFAFHMVLNDNIKAMVLGSKTESIGHNALACFRGIISNQPGTGFNLYCYAKTQPLIYQDSQTTIYWLVRSNHYETFHYPAGSDYSLWTSNDDYCLGSLGWNCLADL